MAYKAKLMQSTGIDWHQVKLALSTSVPAQHNNAPDIKTWFLDFHHNIPLIFEKVKNYGGDGGGDAAVSAAPSIKIRGR